MASDWLSVCCLSVRIFRIINGVNVSRFSQNGIDIVKIWFGIAYGQMSSIFDRVICLQHGSGSVLLSHVFIYCSFQKFYNSETLNVFI